VHWDFPPPAYLPLTDPIFEYDHSDGFSITGGFVSRGPSLGAPYSGRYFYGDFITQRLWSFRIIVDGDGEGTATDLVEHTADLGGAGAIGSLVAFGIDGCGDLYILEHTSGLIQKIVAERPPVPLNNLVVEFGSLLEGTVDDLECSDDEAVRLASVFGFSATDPNLIQVRSAGNDPNDDAASLLGAIESRSNNPGVSAVVRLRNWSTGNFEQVHEYTVQQTDALESFTVADAAPFVRQSDGRIFIQIRHSVVATFSATGFESLFDWIDLRTEN
jgi:hypothetical protein